MSQYTTNLLSKALLLILSLCLSDRLLAQGGYAMEFDGADDRIEVAHDASLNVTTDASWEAWIYLHDTSSDQLLFATTTDDINTPGYAYTGYYISLEGQRLTFSQGTAGGTLQQTSSSLDPIDQDTWTHLAIVKDGAAVTLYVDGVDLTQTSGTHASIIGNTADMLIGSWDTDNDPLDGYMDEVRVWGDVRTVAEIHANMYRELTGAEADLLMYHGMSNGSGATVTDNSTNTFTGTVTNGASWRSSGAHAGPKRALNFDGVDDYVLLTDMDFSADFTLACWFNAGTAATVRAIMSKQSAGGSVTDAEAEWALLVEDDDSLKFFMSSPETTRDVNLSGGVLDENRWYHVAISMSGTAATLYLDGIAMGTDTYAGTRRNGPEAVNIGRFPSADTTFWLGDIDEVRMWNDVRTEAEIREAMCRPLEGSEANLEAYYRFDLGADVSHTVAYDLSSNAHNGTLTNMDASTDRISSSAYNTWLGGTDTDASKGENWSRGGAPSGGHVGIYLWEAGTSPQLDANRAIRQMYIATTASLSLGSFTLSLDQHLINEGSIDGEGGLLFGGIVDQKWLGSGSAQIGTLELNNNQGLLLSHSLQVDTSLTLTSGVVQLSGIVLTMDTTAVFGGSASDANHLNATAGTLRKLLTTTGNISYPLGDGTNYSPIQLNFTTGSYSSAHVDVSVTDSRHPKDTTGSNYITRYWTVNTTGISGFSCVVTSTYVDADIVGSEDQLMGAKWNGSGWAQLNAADINTNTFFGTVTSFSDFTARDVSVLPLAGIFLQAKAEEEFISLSWHTLSNDRWIQFFPEKQLSNGDWETLGEAVAGKFDWQDDAPQAGIQYYRIRAISQNGTTGYSAIQAINWEPAAPMQLFPTQVSTHTILTLAAGLEGQIQLFDNKGKRVKVLPVEEGPNRIEFGGLPAGMYHLQLIPYAGGQQPIPPMKLLKQ